MSPTLPRINRTTDQQRRLYVPLVLVIGAAAITLTAAVALLVLAAVGVEEAQAAVATGTNAAAAASRGGDRTIVDVVDRGSSMIRTVLTTIALLGLGWVCISTGFDRKFGIAIPAALMLVLGLVFLAPGGTDILKNTGDVLSLG